MISKIPVISKRRKLTTKPKIRRIQEQVYPMQVKNYEAKVSQDLKDILVATSNRRIIGID